MRDTLGALLLTVAVFALLPASAPAEPPPPRRAWEGGVDDAAFSPDGKVILTTRHFCGKNDPGELALWDATKGQGEGRRKAILWTVSFAKTRVLALAFSADGKTAMIVEGTESSDNGCKLRKFRVAGGKEVEALDLGNVGSPAFTAGGSRLIGLLGGDACLWDVGTGKRLHRLPLGENGINHSLAASPDGKRLLTWTDLGPLTEWDLKKGEKSRELLPGKREKDAVYLAEYVPGQKAILLGDGLCWRMLDDATGKKKDLPEPLSGFEGYLRYSPDGKLVVAIAHKDVEVSVHDGSTGKKLHGVPRSYVLDRIEDEGRIGGPYGITRFAPDGQTLLIAGVYWGTKEFDFRQGLSGDRTALLLWDLKKGKRLRLLALPKPD